MRDVVKKWFLKAVILSLIISSPGVRANPDSTSQIPNSANWINLLFQVGSSLSDIGNPTNWVIYSAAGTYFYYQYILKGSLKTAKSARDSMLIQLREVSISLKQKENLIAQMDQLIAELELKVSEAEKAFDEIPSHFQRLNKERYKSRKQPFLSMKDYAEVEEWLKDKEGRKFLQTKKGKTWKERYDFLKYASTGAIDEPLKKVIDKANEVFDGKKASILSSSTDLTNPPGVFTAENNLTYQRTAVHLKSIGKQVGKLKKECVETLSTLVRKQKHLDKESNYFRFWSRPENLKPSLVHGIVAAAGVGGTFWLHRISQFDQKKRDAEEEAKLNGKGAYDLGSTLKMQKSREVMKPYYQAIRTVLIENEEELIADFERNLTPNEKSGLDLRAMVRSRLKSSAFDVVVESAILRAAKNKFGDRISFTELKNLLEQIKTEPELREGLFRAFNKAVIQDVINSLWSEVSKVNATDKISHELFRKILTRSEAIFLNGSKSKFQLSDKMTP